MIGNFLKERRLFLSLTQPYLASRLGVTKQTILKWENGQTEPKASQVLILSQVLCVTPAEICSGRFLDSDSIHSGQTLIINSDDLFRILRKT